MRGRPWPKFSRPTRSKRASPWPWPFAETSAAAAVLDQSRGRGWPSAVAPVPARRFAVVVAGERGLHDQGVLAGVVVVAAPSPDHPEAERLVERPCLGGARPDLQDDESQRAVARVLQRAAEERGAEAAPAHVLTERRAA